MVQELLFEYFCRPMIDPRVQGYNLVNTGTYAIILFLAVYFLVYPILKKHAIKVDYKFALALVPFILFGSGLRVITDLGFFTKTCNPLDINFYTFTPGIWLLTAGLAIISLLVAKKLSKKEGDFHKMFAMFGSILAIPIILFLASKVMSFDGFLLASALAVFITLGVKFIVNHFRKGFFSDGLNSLLLAGQVLDGCATFVATSVQKCGEQHPLSESVLGVNPALFIAVKIAIALVLIYFIDRDMKSMHDQRYAEFIKLAAIILGWAPGLRDLLTIAVGTCL